MINIYIITNKINGKQYVGKTKYSIQHRFEGHCCKAKPNNMHIHNAILKYGKDNFSIELLDSVPEDNWKYWETYYIKKYKTHYTQGGYNSTWGGDNNPMDNTRCREAHWKATHTPEYHAKQVKASTGFKHSEESKQKMRIVQSEVIKRPSWIQKNIETHKKQMKPVIMMDENMNELKEFESVKDALVFVGSKFPSATSTITSVIGKYKKNGKPKTVYGYVWKYKNK